MSSISIIGTGTMARTIGTLAVAGGNSVEILGRDQSKAAALAEALGGGAVAGTWGAVPAGDIVITALLYATVVPVVTRYGDALAYSGETSIAQQVANLAPAGASVVKAFNTIFGHVLDKGGRPDVFIAGDDARTKAAVAKFIANLGLRPLDVGALAMAHWLEGAGLLTMGLARNGVGHWDFALGAVEISA